MGSVQFGVLMLVSYARVWLYEFTTKRVNSASKNSNSIDWNMFFLQVEDARVAMRLYQLRKVEWERALRTQNDRRGREKERVTAGKGRRTRGGRDDRQQRREPTGTRGKREQLNRTRGASSKPFNIMLHSNTV